MTKKEKIKSVVKEHGMDIAAIAVPVIAMTATEIYIKKKGIDPIEVIRSAKKPVIFEDVRHDVKIVKAFATVEYADGEIGIVDDIISLAQDIAEQNGNTITFTKAV